jgi:hypothetical protein
MATTQVNLAEQVEGVLPIAEGGTGNATGAAQSAAVATKLATARTLQANLASTGTGSFDGSANTTLGVTGTLALANGGTGATTAAGVISNLGLATVATTGSYASLTGTPLFGLNPVFVSTTVHGEGRRHGDRDRAHCGLHDHAPCRSPERHLCGNWPGSGWHHLRDNDKSGWLRHHHRVREHLSDTD